MVQLWVLVGLILSAVFVSVLGAAFSIVGVGKLFTGAVVAVWLMAGSLELAKFVIAAFLHQTWSRLNIVFRTYLLVSTVVLSLITSMGIFGFLSNAYQQSSMTLEVENIKVEGLKAEQQRLEAEMVRVAKGIDEIPDSRITRKMRARAEAEPLLRQLRGQQERILTDINAANLKLLDVKGKVGPLIYIAKAFGADIDAVVKYLILMFVFVFDPLAICLVVAVSESMRVRSMFAAGKANEVAAPVQKVQPVVAADSNVVQMPETAPAVSVEPTAALATAEAGSAVATEENVIKMRFAKDDQEAS